jgi:hypothetical protein
VTARPVSDQVRRVLEEWAPYLAAVPAITAADEGVTRVVGGAQLDLFGEAEYRIAAAADQARVERIFEELSRRDQDGEPILWSSPHATPGFGPGEEQPGWRCWLCGVIEGNPYALAVRHGLTPELPDCLTWTACIARPVDTDAGSEER